MEKVISNEAFVNLRNDMDEIINQFKGIENDINQNVRDKYQLQQYEQIVEGSDEDVLQQYENMYDKFAEIVINKNNAIEQSNESIKQINDIIEYIKKLTDKNNFNSLLTKK
ncbi:hypothetical protein QTN25_001137 [Entamoeba marina]